MKPQHRKIFFLIGASGAGKTTAAKCLEKMGLTDLQICYSDRSGVPSPDEMIKRYGSGEEWQRANTKKWVEQIKREYLNKKDVLLDSQTRPVFIDEACQKQGINSYEIILFDCPDEIRRQRLSERGQPELANEQMMNWAKYLREACDTDSCKILDTGDLSIDQSAHALKRYLNRR